MLATLLADVSRQPRDCGTRKVTFAISQYLCHSWSHCRRHRRARPCRQNLIGRPRPGLLQAILHLRGHIKAASCCSRLQATGLQDASFHKVRRATKAASLRHVFMGAIASTAQSYLLSVLFNRIPAQQQPRQALHSTAMRGVSQARHVKSCGAYFHAPPRERRRSIVPALPSQPLAGFSRLRSSALTAQHRAAVAQRSPQQIEEQQQPDGGGVQQRQEAAAAFGADFDWRNQWYPVAFSRDLPEGKMR